MRTAKSPAVRSAAAKSLGTSGSRKSGAARADAPTSRKTATTSKPAARKPVSSRSEAAVKTRRAPSAADRRAAAEQLHESLVPKGRRKKSAVSSDTNMTPSSGDVHGGEFGGHEDHDEG